MNFKQKVHSFMKLGYDQNQATSLAMGLPADGPQQQQQQQAPAKPKPKKPPAITRQERTRDGQLQTGVKSRQKKRSERKNVQSLRIKLDQSALLANSGGPTPNLG